MDQKIKEMADSFFEWPTENKSFVTLTSALLFAEKIMEQERERCAQIAEGFERTAERHWIPESFYATLREELAAEIRRT